jgi:putative flippase GtrA
VKIGQIELKQKSSFVLIGALNTSFAFLLFSLLISFSQRGNQVLYINMVSSGISYMSGYFLYKYFVWSKSKISLMEFFRFVKSNLIFLGINLASLHIFVNILDFAPVLVQLVTTGSLVVVSFLIHDNWTFDQLPEVPEERTLAKGKSEH